MAAAIWSERRRRREVHFDVRPKRKTLDFHRTKHAKSKRGWHLAISAVLFALAILAACGAAWFVWWNERSIGSVSSPPLGAMRLPEQLSQAE